MDSDDWAPLRAQKVMKKVLKARTTRLLDVPAELSSEFDGKTPEVRMWLAKVNAYIYLKQNKIPTSTAKILFAGSRMIGQAKVLFRDTYQIPLFSGSRNR